MTITTALIKELREVTGAGPLDCKKALLNYAGDLEKAADYLREKGLAKAAQKTGRETTAGLVIVKSAENSACMVEVNCETDFVARTDYFKTFAHRAADQVLASSDLTTPADLSAAEFIDAPGKTTADVMQELIARLGENITIGRIARYTTDRAGLVASYIHAGDVEGDYGPLEGRIGVLVQLRVEHEPFDADKLQDLAHDLTLQITSASPRYLTPGDIPDEVIQAAKIQEGKLNRLYQDVCLLKQAFVRDDTIDVETLLRQKSSEIGSPVSIVQFARFEVGV
jgi:elongation factor Ts